MSENRGILILGSIFGLTLLILGGVYLALPATTLRFMPPTRPAPVDPADLPPRAPGDPPSKKEVLFVVQNMIGFEANKELAHQLLADWDERAVPVLREVAYDGVWESESFLFFRVLESIESPQAVELFFDLLKDRPYSGLSDPANEALNWASGLKRTHSAYWRVALSADARFPTIVLGLVERANATGRKRIAECAESFAWDAAVPTLEGWLKDPDQDVRKAAAQALETITGVVHTIHLEQVRFPRTELHEGLLQAVPIEASFSRSAITFKAAQGRTVSVEALNGPELEWRDDSGALLHTARMPQQIEELAIWHLGNGTQILVARSMRWSSPNWVRLNAFSTQGEALWSYSAERPVDAMRTFLTATGEPRIALHTGSQLVVLRPDGSVVENDFEPNGAYVLLSHPAFPGRLFTTYFGRFDEYRFGAQDSAKYLGEIDVEHYPLDGALLPDADGEPVFVYSYNDDASVPRIGCATLKGTVRWRATVAESTVLMQVASVPDQGDFVVTVEHNGAVSVFDVQGTLLGRLDLRAATDWPGDREFWVFTATLSSIDPTTWRLFMMSSAGNQRVDIDLSQLGE